MAISESLNQDLNARCASDVKQICQPLFEHLAVQDFGYSLIRPSGEISILSSNISYLTDERLLDLFARFHGAANSVYEILPANITSTYFMSDAHLLTNRLIPSVVPVNEALQNYFIEYYKIVDRLFITTKHKDYVENFVFLFDCSLAYKTLVLNQYSLFVHFIQYFNDKASQLIKEINARPIISNEVTSTKSFYDNKDGLLQFDDYQEFLSKTSINKLHLMSPGNEKHRIYLTKKEQKYAEYIIKGLSAHEIGDLCSVSKRTIETHINNIKNKLAVNKKSDLIEKLLELNICAHL